MSINDLRRKYHDRICKDIIRIRKEKKGQLEYPNFADGTQKSSREIGMGIIRLLGYEHIHTDQMTEQTAGKRFEEITRDYIQESFQLLEHLRPGKWQYQIHSVISNFNQYEHLSDLMEIYKKEKSLSAILGGGYLIQPDIVISRFPVSDHDINRVTSVIDNSSSIARYTGLREGNYRKEIPVKGKGEMKVVKVSPILHASISCKWSIRSDRSQNTRTEALNLIRYRKGPLPHIVAITAEPTPTRIASLALGTGDLDCVYHFALNELQSAVTQLHNDDQLDMLTQLVDGRRLRDISDLPFDLAT